MKKYTLPRGIVKACAGIVESATTEPYITHIVSAEHVIGTNYAIDKSAQIERSYLIEAIKLNLINRREFPYEYLARYYNLPVSLATFKREKIKYCYALAELCGFVRR